MSRTVIEIDAEKCVGCGLCARTCKQSAIAMIDGKAKVVRDDYCDGIGNCLPVCPVGAIRFSDKPVTHKAAASHPVSACPGQMQQSFAPAQSTPQSAQTAPELCAAQLRQWPVQIKLVPVQAPYFNGAHLLIAADCTAYAYGNFHSDFIKDRITIVGCPKLDAVEYTDKLTEIIKENNIQTVTVVRMEVPCCGGIERAAVQAVRSSGKDIPLEIKTISIKGEIVL